MAAKRNLVHEGRFEVLKRRIVLTGESKVVHEKIEVILADAGDAIYKLLNSVPSDGGRVTAVLDGLIGLQDLTKHALEVVPAEPKKE